MCRETTSVELEMYDFTSNNWSPGILTRILRESLEDIPGKHSIYTLPKDSYPCNITPNTESAAV
jgi:hypothetical protein